MFSAAFYGKIHFADQPLLAMAILAGVLLLIVAGFRMQRWSSGWDRLEKDFAAPLGFSPGGRPLLQSVAMSRSAYVHGRVPGCFVFTAKGLHFSGGFPLGFLEPLLLPYSRLVWEGDLDADTAIRVRLNDGTPGPRFLCRQELAKELKKRLRAPDLGSD